MKKILMAGLIAISLAACNNSGETTENKKDSIDSMAREQKNMIDSTAEKKEDRIDSTAERKKDSLDRKDSLKRENKKETSKKKY